MTKITYSGKQGNITITDEYEGKYTVDEFMGEIIIPLLEKMGYSKEEVEKGLHEGIFDGNFGDMRYPLIDRKIIKEDKV